MKLFKICLIFLVNLIFVNCQPWNPIPANASCTSNQNIYNFQVTLLNGTTMSLANFKNKVCQNKITNQNENF